MSDRLSIAILAGGASRRMGRDKALLPLPPAGASIIRTLALRASPLTDDLMIIGQPRPEFLDLPARTVPDVGVRAGPLTGMATALSVARHPSCLIVACDLPLLQPALLAHLCQSSVAHNVDAVIPRLNSSGASAPGHAWQPLLAIYHQRCLPAIAHLLAHDERRVQSLFDAITIQPVPEAELRRFDPDLLSFINVNDLSTYQRVRDFLAGEMTRSQFLSAGLAHAAAAESG